jgi:hypothetical protein
MGSRDASKMSACTLTIRARITRSFTFATVLLRGTVCRSASSEALSFSKSSDR